MLKFSLTILLLLAALIQGTLLATPIVLSVLLVFLLIYERTWIFLMAFLSGIILDVISLRTIGATSLFFVIFLFIAIQYARKFETKTARFVLFSSFIGSLIFLFIFGYTSVLQQSVINSLIALLLFTVFIRIYKRRMLTD